MVKPNHDRLRDTRENELPPRRVPLFLSPPPEIQVFCSKRLADSKVPKVIHVTKEVPRTATGNIQRRYVAACFLKGL
jgi:acyl-CoA synthetase (AMP-forming)/AMP-acid ligase II